MPWNALRSTRKALTRLRSIIYIPSIDRAFLGHPTAILRGRRVIGLPAHRQIRMRTGVPFLSTDGRTGIMIGNRGEGRSLLWVSRLLMLLFRRPRRLPESLSSLPGPANDGVSAAPVRSEER